MKKMNSIQFFVTLVLSIAILLISEDNHAALSFLLGGLTIWYGFLSWAIGMGFIFQKKYIALAIGIIVFKYAILGVIIYWFVHQAWSQPLWYALGVASFIITALAYAVMEALKKEENKNVI
jgi:hypothetical protein